MHFGRGGDRVKRVFDLLPPAKMAPADFRSVGSSFNLGGVYRQKSMAAGSEGEMITINNQGNAAVNEYGNEAIR